jgi:hypothetical protein
LAAAHIQNAGKDTLYYAHTDYQGSLTALSLVVERYAYDPWGISYISITFHGTQIIISDILFEKY